MRIPTGNIVLRNSFATPALIIALLLSLAFTIFTCLCCTTHYFYPSVVTTNLYNLLVLENRSPLSKLSLTHFFLSNPLHVLIHLLSLHTVCPPSIHPFIKPASQPASRPASIFLYPFSLSKWRGAGFYLPQTL